jgi:hypothetical protein
MNRTLVPRWVGRELDTLSGAMALCLSAFLTAGRNQWLAVLTSGAPLLASGVLLLASRRQGEEV